MVFLSFVEERTPRIEAVEPGGVVAHGAHNLTLTGSNFGVVDLSPKVFLGGIECLTTAWISDRQVMCSLPLDWGSHRTG